MQLLKKVDIITALALMLTQISVFGQDYTEADDDSRAPIIMQIEEGGMITVNVPEKLNTQLMNHPSARHEAVEESAEQNRPVAKVGYRVQVFDDNNVRTAKAQAQERKQLITGRFPEFRAYVQFNSPYWRVKVGDFRTRSEAEAAMGAIRAAFPILGSQLRVVRDKINVH